MNKVYGLWKPNHGTKARRDPDGNRIAPSVGSRLNRPMPDNRENPTWEARWLRWHAGMIDRMPLLPDAARLAEQKRRAEFCEHEVIA